MWKAIKWSLGVLWSIFLALCIYIAQEWISGKELKNLPKFIQFLSANLPISIFILISLSALVVEAFRRDQRKNLERRVDFFKSNKQLKLSLLKTRSEQPDWERQQ
jgi:hypothetical protein